MADSRKEYLQSLNRMRNNYQNQGNVLVNNEDDNGNVGNELSAFAYMNTQTPTPEQASKSDRNGWQRTIDTAHSGISNVTEGVSNFLDDVWDFAVVSTSWLSGLASGLGHAIFDSNHSFEEGWRKGTEWTQPLTSFEWEHYLNQWWNQMDLGHAVLTGDMFTGKWGQQWADMSNAEQNKQNLAQTHQNSFANEWGGFGQNVQKVEQGIGYVLPSLVVAYFTGGTSLGAQVGIQAGIAGGTALGAGFEQATKEGASYEKALGYGATKGAISAGTTAILMGIGGHIASSGNGIIGKASAKVGEQVFKSTGKKSLEVLSAKAVEVAIKSGISYGSSMVNQMSDPLIKSIYDDGNAIQEAFGDNEKVKQYLERCSTNATISAITTAIVSAGREGVDLARRGSDGYMANYYSQKAIMAQNHISKELKNINKDLQNNKITPEQAEARLAKLDRYNETVERYGNIALDYAGKLYDKANATVVVDEDGNESTPRFDFGNNKDVIKNLTNLGYSKQQTDVIRALGKTLVGHKWNDNVRLTTSDGDTSVELNPSGQLVSHTYKDQTYNVPAKIDNGALKFDITSKHNVSDVAVILGTSHASGLPTQADIKAEKLNVPDVEATGIKTNLPYTLTKEVSTKILGKKNANEIVGFLENGLKGRGKDNYVVKVDSDKYVIVEPYKDGGTQKYGIITVESKTNKILDINVKAERPSYDRAYIVPKADEQKLLDTKLIQKDGSAIIYENTSADWDWDISDSAEEFSINLKVGERYSNNGVFVYSKNPLKMNNFAKEVPFARLLKTFGIPSSLEKTYLQKTNDPKNELAVLRWVAKLTGTGVKEVLEKLGYDSIVKHDNSVTIFNGGNILRRGVEFKYGKQRGNDYSNIIKRAVSKNTLERLERYSSKNGEELTTTKATAEYTELIRETLSYSVKEIDFDGWKYNVKIVNKDKYTPDMNRVSDVAKKIGVKISFALKLQETNFHDPLDGVSAYWSRGGKEIILFVDSGRRGTLEQTAMHEVGHAIFDKLHGWELLDVPQIISYMEKHYPREVLQKRSVYCAQWGSYDPLWENYNDMIYEEMFADTFAGLCHWKDGRFERYIVSNMKELYSEGVESADKRYYQILANQEAEDQKTSIRYEIAEPPEKIISDLKAKSSNTLIEAGADVSKDVKYRLASIKQAFENAITELYPDNKGFTIKFAKQTFAELNLAKPKDMVTAVDNAIKYLKEAKIVLDEKKVKLGDLLSAEQEEQAREIVVETLKGNAKPTKLSKWAKSLALSRLENKAIKNHIVLLRKFERRIIASKKLNFGYGTAPTAKLTVFENILNSVPRFWSNKGVVGFAESVVANYNENNLKALFDEYGIMFDENIYAVAENLKSSVVDGEHLDPRLQEQADALLKLLFNNLEIVDSSIKSHNVKMAEHDANVIQSMYHGVKHNQAVVGAIKKVAGGFDNAVTSPIDFLIRKAEGTELARFVEEDTGSYENREVELNDKYEKKLFKELANKSVKRLINKKFTFKGEKISYGVALDRLNSYKTLGDKFFNAKGSIKNADSTRGVVNYSKEDIEALQNAIPQELLDYNDKVLEVLNKDLKEDIAQLYKEATGTDLVMLKDDNIWYNISRVSDNFFGANMGGVSMRDINLSMFNKRVNSKADINFNLSLQQHIRNYLHKAFKVLVWTPYVNKLNTLLNTRVYGVTNNKIYQENIVGFDKQMDLLIHQVLGVPFETKVSTLSNVAGKIVGKLNAVRVSTIQAGLRTLSSAPIFAKYFGGKIAIAGAVQNIKNGDILAVRKNYKIIKENSAYFAKRFSSEEVALAETGVKASNILMKIFGTPLRLGDAVVHLTIGFAMAQVQAEQEGYGKPYTPENNARAVYLLEQASKHTQPTLAIGRVAGFRYGNGIAKYLFGLYGSMKQVFYGALVEPIEDIATTKSKIEAMENAIIEHQSKIDEYTKKAQDALNDMDNAMDEKEYREAEEEYEKFKSKAESHSKAKENVEENLKDFKTKHNSKTHLNKVAGAIGGLIFSSLMYVVIRNLISVVEGKKRITDFNIKDLTINTAEQAFLNSMPYLSTLYASIKNNSDLSIATIDNLNNTIDAVKKFITAIESQNGGHITGATWNLLAEASQYFGIPLSAMYRIVNGVWYNIDQASNLDFNNWLGMLSTSRLKSNYSEAVKKGNKEVAIANMEVWAYNNSIKTSQDVLEEIYRLNKDGYTGVAPSAIPTSYVDENGNKVKYTEAQVSAFRNVYKGADKDVLALVKSDSYKSLDAEYKGKVLKKVYTAYYEVAKAKAYNNTVPTGKLAKLLYFTNGDVQLAKYVSGMQNLADVKEDKLHTRKQNVLTAINKMSGFNRQEKLLLAYLSGYSVSDANKNSLIGFLMSKGFTKKEATEYLQ